MYWAVLTLGPMLIGAAIALSVQKVIAPLVMDTTVTSAWSKGGIFLLYWTVFTLIFLLVPYRRVKFRDAIAGALLSAILFELAKLGFVAYISNANYAVIYGALATIPIFLFWLYIVWIVVLFGASLAASLTTFDDSESTSTAWPARKDFQLTYRMVGHLWVAQTEGKNLSDTQLLNKETHTNERQLQHLLHQLEESRVVARDENGSWRLARDLQELSLADLYESGNYHLPVVSDESVQVDSNWDSMFLQAMQDVHSQGLKLLNRPLRPMYLDKENSK